MLLRPFVLLAIVTFGSIFSVPPLYAEHEADHRYTVWGQIKSSAGIPMPDAKVPVTVNGGSIQGETHTDVDGTYRIKLHVHNEDLGKQFVVMVENTTVQAEITFDPDNNRAERIHQLNLTITP